ncbi:hypothetical protein [Salininema proteolyticum]|uniref:Aminoglycoside phosphotransferase domain-containing protein n=1 Tax=Salininema proteolyticum TaxID=1607685 RepID=A0ABV8U1J1_9ACTN
MTEFEDLEGLSHRDASVRLASAGWNVCGLGDWATVWRSPEGLRAARVSPCEPAYGVFTDLCRALPGNELLPVIDVDVALDGGGRFTAMEFMRPVEAGAAADLKERWERAADGDPVSEVRRAAERLNAEAERSIPYWGGLDLNPGNIMADAAGEPRFVDLFFADGERIFQALMAGPEELEKRIPWGERRYLTEIAHVVRFSPAGEIASFREAENGGLGPDAVSGPSRAAPSP